MRPPTTTFANARVRSVRAVRQFCRDRRGATAVEFGLVAVPFFAILLVIMTVGLHYLMYHSLERGVLDAARLLRTGEAQKAGMDLDDFRQLVCESAGSLIACDNHLVIHIKSSPTFAGLAPLTTCATNGSLTPSGGGGSDGIRTKAGDASTAVVVTACYNWEMGSGLWQLVWNLIAPAPATQGKTIMTATTSFRSEPFE